MTQSANAVPFFGLGSFLELVQSLKRVNLGQPWTTSLFWSMAPNHLPHGCWPFQVQHKSLRPLTQVQRSSFCPGQQETWPGYGLPFISTSYIDEGVHDYQIYADQLPDMREMPQNSYAEGEFYPGTYIEEESWPHNGSDFPVVQGVYSTENGSSQTQLTNGCLPCTTWGPENGFYFRASHGAVSSHSPFLNSAVDISSSGKTKAVWYKIRIALKWVISVRRDAAARRKAKLFYYNY